MPAPPLDHDFTNAELLRLALTHRSWCAEHPGEDSNERLEFLGDAVIDLAVATHLYRARPDLPEGEMAKVRAHVVSSPVLADLARRTDLGPELRLGRGEVLSGGHDKTSILADAFEAVVGAIYLDAGWDSARDRVVELLAEPMRRALSEPGEADAKTRLQELAARLGSSAPLYELTPSGPDHDKRFDAVVRIDGRVVGRGRGTSKKSAEQEAAREAWATLSDPISPDSDPSPADADPTPADEDSHA